MNFTDIMQLIVVPLLFLGAIGCVIKALYNGTTISRFKDYDKKDN